MLPSEPLPVTSTRNDFSGGHIFRHFLTPQVWEQRGRETREWEQLQ